MITFRWPWCSVEQGRAWDLLAESVIEAGREPAVRARWFMAQNAYGARVMTLDPLHGRMASDE